MGNKEDNKIHKVADNLYQGPLISKTTDEVEAVFNLMLPLECRKNPKPDDFNPDVYVHLPIEDGVCPGIEWLKTAVNLVMTVMETKKVYIHCRAGISRSATLTAAVLMKMNGWNRDKALNFLAEKNPSIDPAPAYLKLLDQFYKGA